MQDAFIDNIAHETAQHEAYMETHQTSFVGRSKLLKQCLNTLKEHPTGLMVLAGKAGTGKTALMVRMGRGKMEKEYIMWIFYVCHNVPNELK